MTTKPAQSIDWTPIFKYLDENFATKEDVKKIVKEESQYWITQIDNVLASQKITDLALKRMGNKISSKQDLANLREELIKRFSHLPTKEQFYKKMDKWMKAVNIHDLERASHKLAHKQLKDHLSVTHIL